MGCQEMGAELPARGQGGKSYSRAELIFWYVKREANSLLYSTPEDQGSHLLNLVMWARAGIYLIAPAA